MKKLLLTLIIFTALASSALAKTTTIKKYDSHGSYQGKYVTEGNKTKIYKKNGNYDGYLKQSGNKTKRYSKNGNFAGTYSAEE